MSIHYKPMMDIFTSAAVVVITEDGETKLAVKANPMLDPNLIETGDIDDNRS